MKVTEWIFAALTGLIYLLQTTVLCHLKVFGVMPDAVLVCVLCYSMLCGREKGFIAALITGICMDFLSGTMFGRHVIIYLLSSAAASYLADNAFGKNFLTAAIITFAVSLVGGAGMSLYFYIAKIDRNIIHTMFITTPIYAILNVVVGVFVFIFMDNLSMFTYRRERN